MKVRIEARDPITLMYVEGRLDFGAAAGFQRDIEGALAGAGHAPAALVIDCGALEYVSSAGLRVFLQSARSAQRAGVSFALCAMKPAVREVFELSGFNRLLRVHTDLAAALEQAR